MGDQWRGKLMASGPSIEKPQIHRRFVERDATATGADVGPGSIVVIERDANLGIQRVVEIEFEVRHLCPPFSLLPGDGLLSRSASRKSHPERRAIHPSLPDGSDCTHPAISHPFGRLKPHEILGKSGPYTL